MALDGMHSAGSTGHVADHNLIDQTLTQHTSDIAGKIDTATAASTYVAKGALSFDAKDYGAKGDGTSDDTTAIASALSAAGSAGGGVVLLSHGAFKVSSTLTVPDYVTLAGVGTGATAIITASATGTVISLGNASGVRDLKITSSTTRTADYFITCVGNAPLIAHVSMDSYFLGILVGTISGAACVNPVLLDVKMGNSATGSGSGAIVMGYYAGACLDDVSIQGPPGASVQPDFGIKIVRGDTLNASNVNITAHGYALMIVPGTGQQVDATCFVNSLFDSARVIFGSGQAQNAYLAPSGGATVRTTKFDSCWFGASQYQNGCVIAPADTAVVDETSFVGCNFVGNGGAGLYVTGAGVVNWSVTGGFSAGNASAGITATGGTTQFTITGHRSGAMAGLAGNPTGINIAGASDYYVVTDNNLHGNTTAGLYDGGTGVNKVVTNNLTA